MEEPDFEVTKRERADEILKAIYDLEEGDIDTLLSMAWDFKMKLFGLRMNALKEREEMLNPNYNK